MPVPPFFVFDGACGFCRRWVQWLDRRVGGTVVFVPSQGLADLARYGLTDADVARASFWVDDRGRTFRGSRSIAQVLKQATGVWRIIGTVIDLPGIRLVAAAAYLAISRNRHRLPAPR